MAWDVVLPRFRDALTPHGVLAMVDDREDPPPWDADLQALIARVSTNRDFQPYDLIEELEERDLFRAQGRRQTDFVPFEQSLAEYVESFHARNGLSRDRMSASDADAFDRNLTAMIMSHAPNGTVRRRIAASIVWGCPAPSAWQLDLKGCRNHGCT